MDVTQAQPVAEASSTSLWRRKGWRSGRTSSFSAEAVAAPGAAYFDVGTGDHYWISGPHKDGQDALYATHVMPVVDEDVVEEYWIKIRGLPVPAKHRKVEASAGGELR